MKPLLSHSSYVIISLFFLSPLMISIINIPTCICEDDDQYTNCNNTFYCESNIKNLKYPFWGENRESYCGVVANSNMNLTCEERVPKITINKVKYRILEWDDTTLRLRIARDDFWDFICYVKDINYKNNTFENTQFQRYGDVANVTLLDNCPFRDRYQYLKYLLPKTFGVIDCSPEGLVTYYTVAYSNAFMCNESDPSCTLVIPILGSQVTQLVNQSDADIDEALPTGFDLKWAGNYGECKRCLDSGGVCGNNGKTEFRCFCKNGNNTATCHSSIALSSKCQSCVDSGGVCGNDGRAEFRCFCKDGLHTTTCNSSIVSSSSSKRNRGLVIGASVAGFGVTVFIIIMISCCFWISKLLYLDFQILLSTEVVTRLSHDQVALIKTFRGTAQNCARQTINHAASRIKQAQLQLFD